jgi:hypothetical protein
MSIRGNENTFALLAPWQGARWLAEPVDGQNDVYAQRAIPQFDATVSPFLFSAHFPNLFQDSP